MNKVTKQTSYKITDLTIDETVTIPTEIFFVSSDIRSPIGGWPSCIVFFHLDVASTGFRVHKSHIGKMDLIADIIRFVVIYGQRFRWMRDGWMCFSSSHSLFFIVEWGGHVHVWMTEKVFISFFTLGIRLTHQRAHRRRPRCRWWVTVSNVELLWCWILRPFHVVQERRWNARTAQISFEDIFLEQSITHFHFENRFKIFA